MNTEIRELNAVEITNVAGGEAGDTICPPPRHWPFPHPWQLPINVVQINPVQVLGHP